MANYVIGDVQGCFRTLSRLLKRIGFSTERDRLWFVGDLVNRGPASLEVLRWVYAHQDHCKVVLGNHDLYLVRRYLHKGAGYSEAEHAYPSDDTLNGVLCAQDASVLIEWLRAQPLVRVLHISGRVFMLVHAGVDPRWDLAETLDIAKLLSTTLCGSPEQALGLLGHRRSAQWSPDEHEENEREYLAYLTQVRTLDEQGDRNSSFNGSPDDAPAGLRPWYCTRQEADIGAFTIVFGHWAAHGLRLLPKWGVIGTDSGCVWGGSLSAVRLEDLSIFQEPCAEK